MNQDQANPLAQFGDQAPAVQALLANILQPLQAQINQLQHQLAQAQAQPPIDVNAITNAVATAMIQAQAQPAQPGAMTTTREPKVADPPIFSGDCNEVQSFIRSVRTSFSLSPSRFPEGDETRRILFALGFIQGGTAGTWANNTANAILDPNTPNPYATFQEFQEAFEWAFGALDWAQKARMDMSVLHMKAGDTVEEYTTAFEALAAHTGYNEAAHIEAYRSGLLIRIVEKIYGDSNGQLPENLAAWKTKAHHLDNLYQEYKALQSRNPHISAGSAQPRPHQAHVPATSAPVSNTPAPTSDAMDVDGHRNCVRSNTLTDLANPAAHTLQVYGNNFDILPWYVTKSFACKF